MNSTNPTTTDLNSVRPTTIFHLFNIYLPPELRQQIATSSRGPAIAIITPFIFFAYCMYAALAFSTITQICLCPKRPFRVGVWVVTLIWDCICVPGRMLGRMADREGRLKARREAEGMRDEDHDTLLDTSSLLRGSDSSHNTEQALRQAVDADAPLTELEGADSMSELDHALSDTTNIAYETEIKRQISRETVSSKFLSGPERESKGKLRRYA